MSLKKSKIDLLVRVRYNNPIPAPPCPPKLLAIPTDPLRYTSLNYTKALADETPLPVVIDAEMGMPIDLTHWESLWMENGDDADINPDSANLPPVDPRDAWMLSDTLAIQANGGGPGGGGAGPSSSNIVPNVSWLRKTEYISRETRPLHSTPELKITHDTIDISHEAQIGNIESSFQKSAESEDFSLLKYPGKPHLRAVETWEVFPDEDLWANQYDLFKFSERPGDRPLDREDPRLDYAVLRPMEEDGEHFLAYFLIKDEEAIEQLKLQRELGGGDPDDESNTMKFDFIRDYETVKIEGSVPNEFLLTYNDTEEDDGVTAPTKRRAAYYKNIERKIILKKKRAAKWDAETTEDKWDVIKLSYVPFTDDEIGERNELFAEVTDPMYLFRGEAEGGPSSAAAGGGGGTPDGRGEENGMDIDD